MAPRKSEGTDKSTPLQRQKQEKRNSEKKRGKQVAQRHQEVSSTLALPLASVLKLNVGRAADSIGDDVL